MKEKATVVWTCILLLSLLAVSCHAQKLNIHWGPQSMMYLKGKHGRRFVSDDDNSVLKQGLQGWYAVLKGIQRLQSHCELRESPPPLPPEEMRHTESDSLHMGDKLAIH